ncbi:MAG: hypothetical protein GY808_14245 [Gammaproteobacteria bacterium]|nr:hypothetical protein [Gammaproteobacteria bacterium]
MKNNESYTLDEQELQKWSVDHTEQLLKLIETNLPDFVAKEMKKQITINNNFLDNPELRQEPIEDSNWAFLMEQYLNDFISTHELSDDFELINLTCKQLTCGILGINHDCY